MPDEPTMWELQRTFEAGHRELSADIAQLNTRLDAFVLREVYEAHRLADERQREAERAAADQRYNAMSEQLGQVRSQVVDLRDQVRKAGWTAISSFLSPIVVAVVLAFVLRGG
ncbi:hypothetical protein ABZ249_25280 [Nocardiopsis sp. NPDC006139]|uniref:hypothetical protein n=1 Tax=Nocardiopsis sp. NPDC006139 TaxID=3154578 RepID=UPI0033A307A9